MDVVVASQIEKTYEEGRRAVRVLHGVSITLRAGEAVALEGPSGSGKTTLLSILGCILTPSAGTLTVAGQRVDPARPDRLPRVRRRSIGFVFQQYNLFPALNAAENVELALNVKGVRGPGAVAESRRLLTEVGLGHRLDFLPRDLSGGEKQRVAIARALAARPQVLLADEPTANLDSATGAQILDLLRDQTKRGSRALLVVTHDPQVRRICDRVLQIRDGRLLS